MATNLVFGADPEFFVVEKIDNEEYAVPVPVFFTQYGMPVLDIDDEWKHPVLVQEPKYKIIMDGVAAEFTLPAVKTAKEMFNNVTAGLNHLSDIAGKFGFEISVKPAVHYDFYKYYDPDNRMLSWCGIFGCDKDYDVFLGDSYDSPTIDVKSHGWRYGGGHLHTSDNNLLIPEYPIPYTKLMAIFCGNYAIANSKFPELDKKRAFKYGQPGRYRPQTYNKGTENEIHGIEYRSPSNVWTADLDMCEGMFYCATKAYELLSDLKRAKEVIRTYAQSTIEAIGSVNAELSSQILSSIL